MLKSNVKMLLLSSHLRPPKIVALLETLLGRFPVDHVPDSVEVFGLAVLVLQATQRQHDDAMFGRIGNPLIGVLPSVNAQ